MNLATLMPALYLPVPFSGRLRAQTLRERFGLVGDFALLPGGNLG
jgi:hypothetical protein